ADERGELERGKGSPAAGRPDVDEAGEELARLVGQGNGLRGRGRDRGRERERERGRSMSTTDARPRILAADDQPDVLEALRLLLKREGMDLSLASSPAGALAALQESEFDAALLDLNYTRDTTSGKEGLDLLSQIRALDASLPVIVMTAWGSVEGAVEAM